MTSITKTSLISGNYSLQAFEEDGKIYGANPIKEGDQYGVILPKANVEYVWDFSKIGHSVQPETLFAFKSTGITNNDSFVIKIKDASTQSLIWEIELAGNNDVLGKAFFYEFPHLYISTRHLATITSAVDLDNFVVFGHKVYVNEPPYSPTYAITP